MLCDNTRVVQIPIEHAYMSLTVLGGAHGIAPIHYFQKSDKMMTYTSKTITIAAACLAVVITASVSSANAAGREVVSFRAVAWNAAHFDDAKSAQLHHDTLRQIGCEAKQHKHGGHYDVSYRCPKWRSIALKSHAEAHQWERWLKSAGFETAHEH